MAGCSSWEFKRVPPGQSLNVALAQKAIAVRPFPAQERSSPRRSRSWWWDRPLDPKNLPGIEEPELPAQSSAPDANANFFARGNDYLQSGKVKEAVAAYEKAVKSDPSYPDAHIIWHSPTKRTGRTKRVWKNSASIRRWWGNNLECAVPGMAGCFESGRPASPKKRPAVSRPLTPKRRDGRTYICLLICAAQLD